MYLTERAVSEDNAKDLPYKDQDPLLQGLSYRLYIQATVLKPN